jgi:hypothetical protein
LVSGNFLWVELEINSVGNLLWARSSAWILCKQKPWRILDIITISFGVGIQAWARFLNHIRGGAYHSNCTSQNATRTSHLTCSPWLSDVLDFPRSSAFHIISICSDKSPDHGILPELCYFHVFIIYLSCVHNSAQKGLHPVNWTGEQATKPWVLGCIEQCIIHEMVLRKFWIL